MTWTWDQGYGALACLWLTLCQFHTRVRVEYLPVYTPSPEEAADPREFAVGVRAVMAEALGIPTVEKRLEHAKEMVRFSERKQYAESSFKIACVYSTIFLLTFFLRNILFSFFLVGPKVPG